MSSFIIHACVFSLPSVSIQLIRKNELCEENDLRVYSRVSLNLTMTAASRTAWHLRKSFGSISAPSILQPLGTGSLVVI